MAAGSYRKFNTLYYSYFYILFAYLYILEEYVGAGRFQGLPDEACRGFPMRHVGLRWVSNLACRSPMGLR